MRSLINVKKAVTNKVQTNADKDVVNGQKNIGLGGVGRSKKHE
ncbi:MAG: xanthine dehydrogenase large subunit, partial [Colwellia sp.]